jgi:ADP-ribose pyrophosphatase YjhB (NUDIX family)
VSQRIPENDDRLRFVCDTCEIIHYENPKMVVGTIPVWDHSILFCRRAIEPRYGKWTLPAGFLENGETVEEGARRETYEEAGAKLLELEPYGVYNLAFISQVYLMFRARLLEPNFNAGYESLEVRLFEEHEVPWEDLAFPVIRKTLQHYFEDLEKGAFSFHMGDITPEWDR